MHTHSQKNKKNNINKINCRWPTILQKKKNSIQTYAFFFRLPAKMLVFVNLWSISRDSSIFSDPDKFDPYRFLDAHGKLDRTKAETFLPYGAGRRRCPGEQLARLEIFTFFCKIVQKCKMEIPLGSHPIIDSKYGLTLKPLDYEVVFSQREK